MASSSSLLEDLPPEALKHTVSFLGNIYDYLRCERTCKKLQQVIADDELWGKLPLRRFEPLARDPRLATRRAKACLAVALRRINTCQRWGDEPFLLEVVAEHGLPRAETWKDIVSSVLVHSLPHDLTDHQQYFLRGDTMAALVELLESFLVTSFQRALLITVQTCPENEYPSLTLAHLRLADALADTVFPPGPCHLPLLLNLSVEVGNRNTRLFPQEDWPRMEMEFANSLIPESVRDKIIRRIAFVAGVTKMESAVFDYAWIAVVKLIGLMYYPVCLELVGSATSPDQHDDGNEKRPLVSPGETMRNFPPWARALPFPCDHCGAVRFQHTPVPKQLEDAAHRLRPTFPLAKVYAMKWLHDGGNEETMWTEIAVAEQQYQFLIWDDDSNNDSSNGEDAADDEDEGDENMEGFVSVEESEVGYSAHACPGPAVTIAVDDDEEAAADEGNAGNENEEIDMDVDSDTET